MSKKLEEMSKQYSKIKFDSVSEMIEHAHDRSGVTETARGSYDHFIAETKTANKFRHGYTAQRALREIETPPASSAKVQGIMAEIEGEYEFKSTRRRLANRREDGDELDAGAWIRRETDGWNRMERTAFNRKVIRIAVLQSIHSGSTADHLYYRGAAAVALADALEAAGHSVEIASVLCQKGLDRNQASDHFTVLETTVKHADQPMDVDSLALICAEIGFFRTIGFISMCASVKGNACHGLGRPRNISEVETEAKQYDIVMDGDIRCYDQAVNAVKKYAKEFEA